MFFELLLNTVCRHIADWCAATHSCRHSNSTLFLSLPCPGFSAAISLINIFTSELICLPPFLILYPQILGLFFTAISFMERPLKKLRSVNVDKK